MCSEAATELLTLAGRGGISEAAVRMAGGTDEETKGSNSFPAVAGMTRVLVETYVNISINSFK